MVGLTHHSVHLYLTKLVRAGFRVLICEQLEKPSKEKKIVKRGVTELVTPGIAVDENLLDHKSNNFLASLHLDGDLFCVLFLDFYYGDFFVTEGNMIYVGNIIDSFLL